MSTLSVKVITDVTSDSYVDNSLAAANSFANAAATSVSSSYNTANAAFNAANNVNLGPVFAVANAAYGNANTKLANTDITITGNVTTTQVFTDSKGEMRNIPLNNQSSTYTLVLSDAGKFIATTGNINVPNGVFFTGNVVSVYNNSASTITIANNNTTIMYLAGTGNVINRLVAQRGIATILCVSANTFVVSGAGVT